VPSGKAVPQAGDCQRGSPAYTPPVENSYGWRAARETPMRLPGPDNMGWWVAAAFFVAVILHVAAFFALSHVKISQGTLPAQEITTEQINLEPVEVLPPDQDLVVPEEVVEPPPPAANLLEEIDMLAKLPEDTEMDIQPDLAEPEFAVRLENPAMEGDPQGVVVDPAAGIDLDTSLPELGRTDDTLPLAAESQVIVDPGASVADDSNLDRFAEDLLKKGAGGLVQQGSLDGVVTLDDMAGLSPDVLVGKKTMLPSDLLFEYDSAELRESARVGMMKLALIIDRNPNLYCWIEGYSDLYGSEAYNLDLSRRRANAVREYLVNTLRLDGAKIVPRGYGIAKPLVPSGTVEEQAPNRRVEIRMRRTPPPAQTSVQIQTKPETATPQSPVRVKPMRALPVEEDPPARVPQAAPQPAPKARMVEEAPAPASPPRAKPVEEDPPKAEPVEEEPPKATEREPLRAEPVEEQ
jgi:OmpA-OmpF porin, OOP family